MQSLEKMKTFVQVVEANSYVAVSKKMNLSKAAISKQITVLEQELGVKLLQRTTRRLSLTEAGELYYIQCKQMLELAEEMNELVSTLRKEPTGTLKVFSSRYFAECYIVPHLGEFIQNYPKVKLILELGERIPDIVKEEIDIVVGVSIPGPPEAIQRSIAKTHYVFCASPSYLKQFGLPSKPLDLVNHRYISHSMRIAEPLLTFDKETQVHIDPFLRLNDTKSMLTCALNGIGIVKVHAYFAQGALERGELVQVLASYSQEEYPIYLYYMQNRYLTPKIRQFIDFLIAKISLKKEFHNIE